MEAIMVITTSTGTQNKVIDDFYERLGTKHSHIWTVIHIGYTHAHTFTYTCTHTYAVFNHQLCSKGLVNKFR